VAWHRRRLASEAARRRMLSCRRLWDLSFHGGMRSAGSKRRLVDTVCDEWDVSNGRVWLMRQARTRAGMPIWQRDEDDQSLSVVITRTGKKAIASEEKPADDLTAPQQLYLSEDPPECAAAEIDAMDGPVDSANVGDPT
jgi:hypothetical protein